MIDGADTTPWNLLHDGRVVRAEREGDVLSVWIDAAYLGARVPGGPALFRVRLSGCERFVYQDYDDTTVDELGALVSMQPDLVSAERGEGELVIWGSRGKLLTRYASLTVELDFGPGGEARALPLEELRALARAYWAEWDEKVRKPLLAPRS